MGFDLETSVSALTVFLQGLLSFFSPCVLPLVPLYVGYLAAGTKTVDEEGNLQYQRSKVLANTLCFVVGVSFAFFLLGFGFTTAGRFFSGHKVLLARIGGVLVILFGFLQLSSFGSRFFGREHRLPFRLNKLSMNPLVALLLGFTFSFAWTPCVGPALTSVLLMASSASSAAKGFWLIGLYTLGFVLPFLAVGLFTGAVLNFLKKHQKVVRYTVKIGGVLMILMGIMMITGWMNGISSYFSGLGQNANASSQSSMASDSSVSPSSEALVSSSSTAGKNQNPPAPDFTLTDQYGKQHTLSEYKGKVVFLNFWATWCPPCREEMPDIQALYERYGQNEGDVVVLGVANPRTAQRPNNQDEPQEKVEQFLRNNGYHYPVGMDLTGESFSNYFVSSLPTTFMIDKEGNLFGYVQGMLTEDMMESIVRQTIEGKRSS